MLFTVITQSFTTVTKQDRCLNKLNRYPIIYAGLTISILLLFVISLSIGAVDIPTANTLAILMGHTDNQPSTWGYIITQIRLPQALAALLCGASLAASGLLLQTSFDNALAGPDVFGISSGASLGVAVVMLLSGGTLAIGGNTLNGYLAVIVAAFSGAIAVTLLLLFFSTKVRNHLLLLIVGLMVGYIASSAVTLLNTVANADSVRSFVFWGMASFGNVSLDQIPLMALILVPCIGLSLLLIKTLDALLLGDQYAESLGTATHQTRRIALLLTGLLTAVTVAFCGPVSFIGLVVPHLARLVLGTAIHRHLLPASLLIGAALSLVCSILSSLPTALPLNAITPLFGAPVIIYVIIRQR